MDEITFFGKLIGELDFLNIVLLLMLLFKDMNGSSGMRDIRDAINNKTSVSILITSLNGIKDELHRLNNNLEKRNK